MSLPQLHIYAKICKKYAKYASMKFICIICTPHFADVSLPRLLDRWHLGAAAAAVATGIMMPANFPIPARCHTEPEGQEKG